MATSLNDTKRSKLYAAENLFMRELRARTVTVDPDTGERTGDLHPLLVPVPLDELDEFIQKWAKIAAPDRERRTTWKANGRRLGAVAWRHGHIEFESDRNGDPTPWARRPYIILHELAHTAIPMMMPGHGREFVRVLRELVRLFAGDDTVELYDTFLAEQNCSHEVTRKERSTFRHVVRHVDQRWDIRVITHDGTRVYGLFHLDVDDGGNEILVGRDAWATGGGASTRKPNSQRIIPLDDVAYILWRK